MDDALAIAGRVAIVTGAGNGLGRAESLVAPPGMDVEIEFDRA